MTGTPCDVPVPKNLTMIFLIILTMIYVIYMIFLMYHLITNDLSGKKPALVVLTEAAPSIS
jgi:hypothetical protein